MGKPGPEPITKKALKEALFEKFPLPEDAETDMDDLGTGYYLALKHYGYCRWEMVSRISSQMITSTISLEARRTDLIHQLKFFFYSSHRNKEQLAQEQFSKIESFVNEQLGVPSSRKSKLLR